MRNMEWWDDHRDKMADILIECEDHGVSNETLDALQDLRDRNCLKCAYWSNDVSHFDSGNMATCNHPKITGEHHPSYGCGVTEVTLVYVSGKSTQYILTRWNFSCALWERSDKYPRKKRNKE